tara:strand:+ start:11962 stop:12927 length:966 start_codon:yes stop_codon:yes gene_type:complete
MAEEESTDLLDELMSEIEGEEGEEEFVPASFAMDDLTVEVEQYGEDEQITLNSNPVIHSMVAPTEVEEEEYELSSEDIPLYVKKFEVPDSEEQEEELEQRMIELVQPNAETPDLIQPVPASEVPDTNGWATQNLESNDPISGDFDGDGKVDEFEAAFADETTLQSPNKTIQNVPSGSIPRIRAAPLREENGALEIEDPETEQTPPDPVMSIEESEKTLTPDFQEDDTFWPWHQQEEWPATEIIKQLQAAIRSAKEQNTAQATVLLDEVGPHLGNRTSLVYSVGRLLISIGRNREALRMVEKAFENHPDDPDVARAREKLIS